MPWGRARPGWPAVHYHQITRSFAPQSRQITGPARATFICEPPLRDTVSGDVPRLLLQFEADYYDLFDRVSTQLKHSLQSSVSWTTERKAHSCTPAYEFLATVVILHVC